MRLRFNQKPSLLLLLSSAFIVTGCTHSGFQRKPATMSAPGIVILRPDQVQSKDDIAKALAQVADDYRTHIKGNMFALAAIDRNRFVFTIMGQIEATYGEYEHSFRSRRATAETIADAGLLGVTAAASVVGTAGIKDMLTAAGVAGGGTKLSAEKNFFNEEGTVALLTQMRASRSVIEAQIVSRCGTDVSSYSLEEAWKDLNKYVNAGSIESAMIQLASNAGSQNTDAQRAVDAAVASVTTPATDQDLADSVKTRGIVVNLIQAIAPPAGAAVDAAKAQRAADTITAILKGVGDPPPGGTTQLQLVQLLRQKLFTNNAALSAKLSTALHAAPVEFGGDGQ